MNRYRTHLCAVVCLATAAHAGAAISNSDSILVVNPSFQANGFGFPGYGDPTGWDGTDSASGVSNTGYPFAADTNPPHDNQAAFMQNGASMTQAGLTGFDIGESYWIQVFYSKRQPSQGGTSNPNLQVDVLGSTVAEINNIDNDGNPYAFSNTLFTAGSTGGDLTFINTQNTDDSAALIDAISIIRRDANEVVIMNPSFEGSTPFGDFQQGVPLAGWTATGGAGVQKNNGTGFDQFNADQPDGLMFAILQDSAATLSQTINNLAVGELYELSYMYKARGAQPGTIEPTLLTTIGGIVAQNETLAIDSAADFEILSFQFTATASSMDLVFAQTTSGDATALVDNVSIRAVPVPSPVALPAGLALIGIAAARRRR